MIVFSDRKLLNEKHIEEQLEHSSLSEVTSKYPPELRKQRQELLKDCNKQPCRRFLEESSAVQIIMDYRTPPTVSFKTKLGLNQHDPIMTQEQSVLSKIKSIFSAESISFQHWAIGYRIDAYLSKYKLAIEIDELGHKNRDKKTKRQKGDKRHQKKCLVANL